MPHATTDQDSPILIITGMHRSGTSLTAALLQSAGVHVGDRLLGAYQGNPKGHFENLDFWEFHRQVLESQGHHPDGWTLQKPAVADETMRARAKELVRKNTVPPVWGWKDPRTVLFLDFWADLLPQAKFLFVFRAPWLVVDSLYRRGDEVFEADPELAIKAWIFYNQAILDFVEARGDEWARQHCLMVDVGAIAEHPKAYLDAICTRLQIPLHAPEQFIVDPALLHQQIQDKDYPHLIQKTFPEAISLYQRQIRQQVTLTPEFQLQNLNMSQDNKSEFQQWMDSRKSEPQANHIPFWSVMIPAYNSVREYLVEALESVLAQDPGQDEMQIEVVDDCSTELDYDLEALVQAVGKGRVQLYRQPQNVGLPENWNTCVQRAKGQWVHILHHDDIVLPGFYEALRKPCGENLELGAAFCRHKCVDELGHERWISWLEKDQAGLLTDFLPRHVVQNRIQTICFVVKRQVYNKIGYYRSDFPYCSDWDFTKRLVAHYPIWYEPRCLAIYRWHPKSATAKIGASGHDLTDILHSIERSHLEYPEQITASLSGQAMDTYINYGLQTVQEQVQKGSINMAIAQLQQVLQNLDYLNGDTAIAQAYRNDQLSKFMTKIHQSQSSSEVTADSVSPASEATPNESPQPDKLQLDDAYPAIQDLQSELDALRQRLQQAQGEKTQAATDYESQIQSLRDENARLLLQCHQVQEELEESYTRLKDTKAQAQAQQQDIQTLQQQNQKLEDDIHQVRQTHQKTEEELEAFRSQLTQVQHNYQHSQQELAEYQDLLKQTQDVLNQSQDQLHETETVLEECHAQLLKTRAERDTAQAELKQANQNAERQQLCIHQVQEELEQALMHHKQLQTQLELVQVERNYFEVQSKAWMQTAQHLEAEYQEKNAWLDNQTKAWKDAVQKVNT